MNSQPPKLIPIPKALFLIVLSTLLISGTAFFIATYYIAAQEERAAQSTYDIVAIIQATDEPEPLKTMCFAESLNLSCDKPCNLYRFNVDEAVQKLYQLPIIKFAKIQKILPGTLYIEYQLRHPIAYLADFSNTAIDQEGVAFPHKPFLTPKNLPEVVLGLDEHSYFQWGVKLPQEKIQIGLNVLSTLNAMEGVKVTKVDLSKACAQSNGQCELIIFVETLEAPHHKILRINPQNFEEALNNFAHLNRYLSHEGKNWKEEKILVDLRVAKLGYISVIK